MAKCSKDDFWNKVELLKHLARDKAQHMKGSIHGFVWSRVEYKGRWCDVCLASVAVKDIAVYLKTLSDPCLQDLRFNLD